MSTDGTVDETVNQEEEYTEEPQTDNTSGEPDTEGSVYMYEIPMETVDGVDRPMYSTSVKGEMYMHHSGPNFVKVIQEKAAGHFHKDDVNVSVTELSKEEVLESDNPVRDFA